MGKTIIMVLHDLNSALSSSDRICLMDKGEMVIHDTPQAVFDSREIDRIFRISSSQVSTGDEGTRQYIFYLK
jgi:iron complex transport system ATP-binding protein